jgi:hypothetical protein
MKSKYQDNKRISNGMRRKCEKGTEKKIIFQSDSEFLIPNNFSYGEIMKARRHSNESESHLNERQINV